MKVLCSTLIDFGILTNLFSFTGICLDENYSKVNVGKNLSDGFEFKNDIEEAEASSLLFFNFPLEYANRMVQVNQESLNFSGTHQLLVYDYYVNLQGENMRIIKK